MYETDEKLAQAINSIDGSEWVYNKYCSKCGKYIYQQDETIKHCKKCRTSISSCYKKAIPFTSSATAAEKLIIWYKSYYQNQQDHNFMITLFNQFLNDTKFNYKAAIAELILHKLTK